MNSISFEVILSTEDISKSIPSRVLEIGPGKSVSQKTLFDFDIVLSEH
jgi:hypothetical protein